MSGCDYGKISKYRDTSSSIRALTALYQVFFSLKENFSHVGICPPVTDERQERHVTKERHCKRDDIIEGCPNWSRSSVRTPARSNFVNNYGERTWASFIVKCCIVTFSGRPIRREMMLLTANRIVKWGVFWGQSAGRRFCQPLKSPTKRTTDFRLRF